jgi:hypothetical protein
VTFLRATDRLLACTKKAFQRGYLCQPTHTIAGSCSTGAAACVPQPLCPWLLHSRALFQRYTVWKFLTTYAEIFASKPSPQTTMKISTSYTIKKGVIILLLTAVLWSLGVMPEALSRLSWSAVPGALAYASVMFLFVLATKPTRR